MRILTLVFMSLLMISSAKSGNGVGNGGDYIRSKFIEMGVEIINYLEKDEEGKNLSFQFKLPLLSLRDSLDIKRIQIVSGPISDDMGSKVDAQGVKNLIRLDENRWTQILTSNNDTYYLVFHEMLRSAGVNDDNYILSFKLSPYKNFRATITDRPVLPDGQQPKSAVTITDKWEGYYTRLDQLTSDLDGRIYTSGVTQPKDGQKTFHWIKLSDDNGATWRVVANFAEKGLLAYEGAHLLFVGKRDKNLYSVGNIQTDESTFQTVLRVSRDHGNTWDVIGGPNGVILQFGTMGTEMFALVLPNVDCGESCSLVIYKTDLEKDAPKWNVVGTPIGLATSSWSYIANTRMFVSARKVFVTYFHHLQNATYVVSALASVDLDYGDLQITVLNKDELSQAPCPMIGDDYNVMYMACPRRSEGSTLGKMRTEWSVRKFDGANLQGEIVDAFSFFKQMYSYAEPSHVVITPGKIVAAGNALLGTEGYKNNILVSRTSLDKGNTWTTQFYDYYRENNINTPAKYWGFLDVKGVGFDKKGAMVIGFTARGMTRDNLTYAHHIVAQFK